MVHWITEISPERKLLFRRLVSEYLAAHPEILCIEARDVEVAERRKLPDRRDGNGKFYP